MIDFKHQSVRTRVLFTFGTLCAILLVIGGMFFFSLRSIENSNRLQQTRALTKLALIDDMVQDVGQMQAGALQQVLASELGETRELDQGVRRIAADNIGEVDTYRAFVDTEAEAKLYENVRGAQKEYWRQTQQMLLLGLANRDAQAQEVINSKQAPAYDEYLKAVSELNIRVETEATETMMVTARSISRIKIIGDILIGAAILIVIGTGFAIAGVARRLTEDNELLQTEITERKQAEECFSGAFEYAASGMALETTDGQWLKVNRALCNLVGYSEAELLARNFRDITHPEDIVSDLAAVDRLLAGEASSHQAEKRYIHADGHLITVLLSLSLVHDARGRPLYLIAQTQDITERERAKEELSQLNADLEQRVALRTEDLFAATQEAQRANRAKSEFLSRISHELRTPLNAILGFSQLLDMEGRGADDADNIEHILKAGHHLLDLVNEVLDISSLEAGRVEINTRALRVNEAVDEALIAAAPLAAGRNVTLEALVCESWIFVDPQRFKQVLLQLVLNAIKYNRPGGRVILAAGETGGFLRLTIADTGPGIAATDTAKIFTAFERLNAGDKVDGIGLGLTISKHLVEMMGGRIGVESLPGEGSTFWIEVPLAENPLARPGGNELPSIPDIESKPANCRTVLYIEDNLANLRLITRILARRPSIQLLSAGTLELGLEMARESHVDLILLDIEFPDGSGDRSLAALRLDPRTLDIPIVALIAEDLPDRRAQILLAGASDVVARPVDVRTLLGVLDQVLEFQPEEIVERG